MTSDRSLFSKGDVVTVKSLGRSGVVIETLSNGSYRISLGAITVSAKSGELSLDPKVSTSPAVSGVTDKHVVRMTQTRARSVRLAIDLHGFTVDQATRALEEWLNQMILSDAKQGKVIHGLGSGRVQRATHETLARYSAVRAFRINDANPGETDVYLG
jgi:DNA mismatch repair protein MutS2